jgi:hypothetical protein
MANAKSFSAPRPEVLHLQTLLRRVESGEIRVPDFQRKYVWKEKQVVELLESVYMGYPIGSLLFWRAASSQLRYDARRAYPMPAVSKARDPVSFLLDGQQRLTTLYGCLYLPENRRGVVDVFNVFFDLRKRVFRHFADLDKQEGMVPLWSLFSPTSFLEVQRDLQTLPDGARLLDESVRLHSVFQEYIVPSVTIEKRPVNEVVEIFERVNRTGTKLSSVDFMRAVTWSSGFDLGAQVDAVRRKVKRKGFALKPETVVKAIAVALGTAPTPDAMLSLRSVPAARLNDGVAKAQRALLATIEFLKTELKIFSESFVPYEGQFLVLSKFLGDVGSSSQELRAEATRWFLAASLNESLRGKPDHVVASLVEKAELLAAGERGVLPTLLRVEQTELLKRRLIRGKALATGVVAVMALNQPRSLFTGKEVAPSEFMGEFNPERFVPVLSQDEVDKAVGHRIESPRVVANVIVCAADDLPNLDTQDIKQILIQLLKKGDKKSVQVLESQVVTRQALARLEAGDSSGFLRQRAKDLLARAKERTKG